MAENTHFTIPQILWVRIVSTEDLATSSHLNPHHHRVNDSFCHTIRLPGDGAASTFLQGFLDWGVYMDVGTKPPFGPCHTVLAYGSLLLNTFKLKRQLPRVCQQNKSHSVAAPQGHQPQARAHKRQGLACTRTKREHHLHLSQMCLPSPIVIHVSVQAETGT